MEDISDSSKSRLRQEQTRLITIIESFEKLEESTEWSSLKELVFNPSLASIERQLMNESLKQPLDTAMLYYLQGQRAWVKQYTDTHSFVEHLKRQLQEIKKKLQ